MTSVYFIYVGSVIFLHIYKSYRREQKRKSKKSLLQLLKSSELTRLENDLEEGDFDEENARRPLLADKDDLELKHIEKEGTSNFFSRTVSIVDNNLTRYLLSR